MRRYSSDGNGTNEEFTTRSAITITTISTKRHFERGVHDKELIMIGSLFVQGVVLLLLHYSEINFKFSYLVFYFLIFP